jgi:putative DNA primase/helicase
VAGRRAGCWADFSTGDKGGDVVSLIAFIEGTSQREAATALARMLGIELSGATEVADA